MIPSEPLDKARKALALVAGIDFPSHLRPHAFFSSLALYHEQFEPRRRYELALP